MNRELAPEELSQQFSLCKRVAEAAGLFCISHERYEADDLIASLAMDMRQHDFRNIIVSGDKDLAQVLRGEDLWWDFARNEHRDATSVIDKFGVPPESIQDYLGLCGDAVDNIPGVPGIGAKTASALLQRYNTIEGVYQNLENIRHLQIRGAKTLAAKLREHQQQAELSKLLATVAYDAPIPGGHEVLKRRSAEVNSLQEISEILGGRGEGLFERLTTSSKSLSA
jgi:5'-3' exonuclease